MRRGRSSAVHINPSVTLRVTAPLIGEPFVGATLAVARIRKTPSQRGSKLACKFRGVLFVNYTPPEIKDFDPLLRRLFASEHAYDAKASFTS